MLDATDDKMLERLFGSAPDSVEFRKLRKRIIRETRDAIETYGMVRKVTAGWSAFPVARSATRCWRH